MPSTRPQPITAITPLVGTAVVQVISSNASRLGLFVYNPGTVTLALCGPEIVAPTVGGTGTLSLTPGQGIQLDEWTAALFAIAASGVSNPITVMEFS